MQGAAMSSTSDPSRMDPYSDDPTAAPGQTAVLDRQLQEREQLTDDGDHDRFAHYVRKDKVTQAALDGSPVIDRKSTRLNSSHVAISYAVFCLTTKT